MWREFSSPIRGGVRCFVSVRWLSHRQVESISDLNLSFLFFPDQHREEGLGHRLGSPSLVLAPLFHGWFPFPGGVGVLAWL